MGMYSTKVINIRGLVPNYLQPAVPTIFMGMPPLPLTYRNPLKTAGVTGAKEVKRIVTTSIDGLSNGGIEISTKSRSPQNPFKSRKRSSKGITVRRKRRNSAGGIKGSNKRNNRDKSGKFKKKA